MKTVVETKAEPGTQEWLRLMSGSKIAAVVGLSRYETPFGLWHRIKGNRPPEAPKDIFAVGHAMEHAMAAYYQTAYGEGWRLSQGEVQYTDTDLPFPNAATIDRRASRGSLRRVVEFKTVRDWTAWGDVDRNPTDQTIPADYYAQLQWNMGITGFTDQPAHLLAMGAFFDFRLYEIPFDEEFFAKLVKAANLFVSSLDLGFEPNFTGTPPDYTCIRELHPDIDGTTVEVPEELAESYHRAVAQAKDAKEQEQVAKAHMLKHMGNAQTAVTPGGTVVAKRTARGKTITLSPRMPK